MSGKLKTLERFSNITLIMEIYNVVVKIITGRLMRTLKNKGTLYTPPKEILQNGNH
jgi:hypothetical protein